MVRRTADRAGRPFRERLQMFLGIQRLKQHDGLPLFINVLLDFLRRPAVENALQIFLRFLQISGGRRFGGLFFQKCFLGVFRVSLRVGKIVLNRLQIGFMPFQLRVAFLKRSAGRLPA